MSRARAIASALERGHVQDAVAEAQDAVRQFPESEVLWKRSAQAHLCEALLLDGELSAAAQRAFLAKHLDGAIQWLNALTDRERERLKLTPENLERLRVAAREEPVVGFGETARKQLAESARTIELRAKAIQAAREATGRARKLGASDTELALTELWWEFAVLLFRKQLDKVQSGDSMGGADERVDAVRRSLAPFGDVSGERTLRSAVALASGRPTDAAAVAGAADLIDLVAVLEGRPRPLQKHSTALLAKRYIRNGAAVNPERTKEAREAASQLYSQARQSQLADVASVPGTVSIQLYERAFDVDKKGSLRYLRPRLLLLRAAFTPDETKDLIDRVRETAPRNGAAALEQVRVALLVDDDVKTAVERIRQASRLSEFDRSSLVAVPEPLRYSLNSHAHLLSLMKDVQPGYGWLFNTLVDTQVSQHDPSAKLELLMLRLRIAELLCKAPDGADRAEGVHHKSLVISELLSFPNLTPQQRAVLQLQEEQHLQAFAGFPRVQTFAVLSTGGLAYAEYPQVRGRTGAEGPQLWAGGAGGWLFLPDVRRKPLGPAR